VIAGSKGRWRWAGPFFALGTLVLAIGVLHFAAPLLIPIGIAVLLAFLLTPVVRWLERYKSPRVLAVGAAVAAVLVALGSLSWIIVRQTDALLDAFPQYEGNLRAKLAILRSEDGSTFSKLREIARKVDKEISGDAAVKPPGGDDAVKVKVVKPDSQFTLDSLPAYASSAGPAVGGAILSVALLAFILMRREDLRERIFGMVGRSRIPITTRALDEATERISRTLLTQFTVNTSFGVAYGAGLALIGIPFAPLWGLLAIAFRYIPFIGATLALLLPFAVSVLTMQGWQAPLLVVGWFVVLQVIIVGLEAWLIGPGIGVSPTATLVMLAFWTWLWGPIALLLATPLTACLMVVARFLPQFRFLEIALGDRPVLNAPDRLYQRLLSGDVEESSAIFASHARSSGFVDACDSLLLPALKGAAQDLASHRISAEEYETVLGNAQALLDGVAAETSPVSADAASARRPLKVLWIARDEGDRLGHWMLRHALNNVDFDHEVCSSDLLVSETVERIERSVADVVCIGSTAPGGLMATKLLCRRLRKRYPRAKLLVARWGGNGREPHEREVLLAAGASAVYTSLDEMRLALIAARPPAESALAAPGEPANEQQASLAAS
jgi:predicted PurR-regulated permease PerM